MILNLSPVFFGTLMDMGSVGAGREIGSAIIVAFRGAKGDDHRYEKHGASDHEPGFFQAKVPPFGEVVEIPMAGGAALTPGPLPGGEGSFLMGLVHQCAQYLERNTETRRYYRKSMQTGLVCPRLPFPEWFFRAIIKREKRASRNAEASRQAICRDALPASCPPDPARRVHRAGQPKSATDGIRTEHGFFKSNPSRVFPRRFMNLCADFSSFPRSHAERRNEKVRVSEPPTSC